MKDAGSPNSLTDILPGEDTYSGILRVIDVGGLPGNPTVRLPANAVAQTAMAYVRGH